MTNEIVEECTHCTNTLVGDDIDHHYCEQCGELSCTDCALDCDGCQGYTCEDCQCHCETCTASTYEECVQYCEDCQDQFCEDCLDGSGLCCSCYDHQLEQQEACHNCGELSSELNACGICDEDACEECMFVCTKCKQESCDDCTTFCQKCQEMFCADCLDENRMCEECSEG